MAELKFLYESTVLKEVEEKVVETKEENGQKIEVSRTVKKSSPVKIALLKPGRKLWESAEIFYAKQIAFYIQSGLLPYSLVAKRYANDGGALSEPEKLKLDELKKEVESLQEELFNIISSPEENKEALKNQLLIRINNVNNEMNLIKNSYSEIFENTAEMKARNKTIEWWVLHLSYVETNGSLKPLFGDGSYDEKINKYDELEDKAEPFMAECIRKLSYLISFWFTARTDISRMDFDSVEKLYQESVSQYKVEDNKENVLITEK